MIHLHCHSEYSVLDGLSRPSDIVKKAKEQGAEAIAITDHASISALPDLFKVARAENIKPIIGCEFYVADKIEGEKDEKRSHLSVWAKDWEGVKSIMAMLTLANKQFYKRPRITWQQALHFEHCMVGSACCAGMIGHKAWRTLLDVFKNRYSDDFYVEVMPDLPDACELGVLVAERTKQLIAEGSQQFIATIDSHYTNAEDARTHEILLAVQSNKSLNDPKRFSFGGGQLYMLSQAETRHKLLQSGYPESTIMQAINNTHALAAKVDIQMPQFKTCLPSPTKTPDDDFKRLVLDGIRCLNITDPAYIKRALYEIGVIKRLGFVKYFMIVQDVIAWARRQGIAVGPGRGSAAGSLVSYLLGITQVDPLQHGLFFERFLNPERVSMPDIDVDFQDNRRDEVFEYMRNKYGLENTSHIGTFGRMTLKSAFRDVARAFDVPYLKANKLSPLIEEEDSFEKEPELIKFARENPEIVKQAKKLNGTVRNVGSHACGLAMSSEPLQNIGVIEHRKDGEVINWDMRQCEEYGILKIDILGLSTLTMFSHCLELLANRGIKLELPGIALDDPKTCAAFAKGRGVGIFQFESTQMQSLLVSIKADTFAKITDCTALFRPGPLNSGLTDRYKNITKGNEYETYDHEALKPILEETKGVIIYQEQIMRIFAELAGLGWAEADKMRKIIGKKLGEGEFEKHRRDFIEGCLATNEIPEQISSQLFDKMKEFAAYSFNKSHAVSYTIISYWAMYLKVYYPLEFMAAAMNSSKEDRIPALVKEAQGLGINMGSPDVNLSETNFVVDVQTNTIIPPLCIIKGVGSKAVESIMAARESGVYLNEADFIERVNRRVVNVRVQNVLKRAGAFESIGSKIADEAERIRNFGELLPTFNALPKITPGAHIIDNNSLKQVLISAQACAQANNKTFMRPVIGGPQADIMVINNNVRTESRPLSAKATLALLPALKAVGLDKKYVYYTGAFKCNVGNQADAPKNCHAQCFEWLKQEIAALKPQLIILFASQLIRPLMGKNKKIGELNGTVQFLPELDCYVLFSFSPQYASFKPEIAEKFNNSMEVLEEIVNLKAPGQIPT